jgi:hypothetical protein
VWSGRCEVVPFSFRFPFLRRSIFVVRGLWLDCLRPLCGHPIRPTQLEFRQPTLFAQAACANSAEPFVWAWLEIPLPWLEDGQMYPSLPLPVACLERPICNFSDLISLTTFWNIIPIKQSVGWFLKPVAMTYQLYVCTCKCGFANAAETVCL